MIKFIQLYHCDWSRGEDIHKAGTTESLPWVCSCMSWLWNACFQFLDAWGSTDRSLELIVDSILPKQLALDNWAKNQRETYKRMENSCLLGFVSYHLCWHPAEIEALLRSYNFCLLWAEFFVLEALQITFPILLIIWLYTITQSFRFFSFLAHQPKTQTSLIHLFTENKLLAPTNSKFTTKAFKIL